MFEYGFHAGFCKPLVSVKMLQGVVFQESQTNYACLLIGFTLFNIQAFSFNFIFWSSVFFEKRLGDD